MKHKSFFETFAHMFCLGGLCLCVSTLSAPTMAQEQASKSPSLQETIGWIVQKMIQSAGRDNFDDGGGNGSITFRGISLGEDCLLEFERNYSGEDHTGGSIGGDSYSRHAWDNSDFIDVPLGDLAKASSSVNANGVWVVKMQVRSNSIRDNKNYADGYDWTSGPAAGEEDAGYDNHKPEKHAERYVGSTLVEFARNSVDGEDISTRMAKALNHAAQLCKPKHTESADHQQKEVF